MNHFYLQKRGSLKSLSEALREKREAERNEMMLENRLAMLQEEEFKNFKKIEETKKKAIEVYLRKMRAKEHLDTKMELKRKREEELGKDKHHFTELRRQQELNLSQVREDLKQLKHEEFVKIRQQREDNEMKRNNYLRTLQQFNANRRMNIQKQINDASFRKKEFFETKMKNFREEYEQRIREEEITKRKKDLRISHLEETESALISRLKFTQNLQEEALRELQTAMLEPVESYQTKYISKTPGTKKSIIYSNDEGMTPKRTDLIKRVRSGANLRYGEHSIRERQNKIQDVLLSISNFRGVANKNPDQLIANSEGPGRRFHTTQDENDNSEQGLVSVNGEDDKDGKQPTHQRNKTTDGIGLYVIQ